jgi:hypothetical protein
MIDGEKRAKVLRELEQVINRNSLENESNTPDWILARMMLGTLEVFDAVTRERTRWYAPASEPNSVERKEE